MGYQEVLFRVVFVVLVAVGFSYRRQIAEIISKTFVDNTSTASSGSDEVNRKTPPPPPIKVPDADYYNPPFDPDDPSEPIFTKSGTRMVTLNELAAHGHSGPLKPIWLAVMGMVFDVDKGAEHYYGPNGGYKFFTGKFALKITLNMAT